VRHGIGKPGQYQMIPMQSQSVNNIKTMLKKCLSEIIKNAIVQGKKKP
jgi:hypothetical protein